VKKAYVLVEGHGEVTAVGNLLHRLASDITWSAPLRWKDLNRREGVVKGAEYVRRMPDAGALLVLRDEDDACPLSRGPELSGWLRDLRLPFPAAVVLFHPEYEVLFLPCLPQMAGTSLGGRPGISAGTTWSGSSWEQRRGVKEWLSAHFAPNRAYKPTLDQLPLTRLIDVNVLRVAGVPCFGTLERAIGFLRRRPPAGEVYPPPGPGLETP
jgi:hypothetical protein